MPKRYHVTIEVPSGSRVEPFVAWMNKLVNPHRMNVIACAEPTFEETVKMRQLHRRIRAEYPDLPGEVVENLCVLASSELRS